MQDDRICPCCTLPIQPNTGGHVPDGRCDACAEEHGCECGCYPPPTWHFIRDDPTRQAEVERLDDGRWRMVYRLRTGQRVQTYS